MPEFASEAEERVFWETHDSADHVDRAAANARNVPYQSLIKVWLQAKVHSPRVPARPSGN